MAENLHQEPARIAAGARTALERLLRGLHPRFHADEILNFARKAPGEIDHEIDGALRAPIDPAQEGLEPRSRVFGRAVDYEIGFEVLRIFERPILRALLNKEIERIVDRHVGDD